MSRALGFFIGFCLLLALVVALVTWWLGPRLLSLAFDSQTAQLPYYGLYFDHSGGSAGAEEYRVRFLQLLATGGGEQPVPTGHNPADTTSPSSAPLSSVVWRADDVSVVAGAVADEWSAVTFSRFVSARQFVRLVTSAPYRQLRRLAPQDQRLLVGTTDAPLQALQHPAALLLLVQTDNRQAVDDWLDQVRSLRGDVVWDAGVAVLEGGAASAVDWNLGICIGFDDAAQLQQWAVSVEAQTSLSLLKANVQAVTLWMLKGLPEQTKGKG